MKMRIAVAADHGGYPLKSTLVEFLQNLGYEVTDPGTHSDDSVDCADYARDVAQKILSQKADRGILICGRGVGASIAANKFPGIRAAVCHDAFSVRRGVEDDDMNILCLRARVIGPELAKDVARVWVAASFSGQERHRRRLAKIDEIEREFFPKE